MPSCGASEQVLNGQFCLRNHFFAEEWWEKFRISRRSRFKSADEMKVNPCTCGRASSIWMRYVWTRKFLNPERKICGFNNIQIRVEGVLEKRPWKVDRLSWFFVQASSFDQLRCGSFQVCLEMDIVGVVVFCTSLSCFSNMHVITDTKWSLVISLSVYYHHQHHRRHFRCRSRHHRHRHFHHHCHHGRHHHQYHYFFKIMLHLIWHC